MKLDTVMKSYGKQNSADFQMNKINRRGKSRAQKKVFSKSAGFPDNQLKKKKKGVVIGG